VNLGLDGYSRAELIQIALIRVEAYPHRQALYNLDIVSSCILGREQAGSISSRGRNILYLAIKRLIERIRLDGYALADVQDSSERR
jgi:hypothetical protein